MIKAKLLKLSDNDNALRTPVVEGVLKALPEVGNGIHFIAEALEYGDFRYIKTSPIVKLIHEPINNIYMAWTQNSRYQIEILGEEKSDD